MSVEADLAALRARVEYLEDRTAILDCVARHARGCDRHDVDVISSTYWPDGVDEHGTTINSGPEYATWANAVHEATSSNHLHNVTTHMCEINGDEAHAESYVLVTMLTPDNSTATVMCGRYVDRFERRDGAWRIALRRSTVELAFTADASLLRSKFFTGQGYIHGTRDHTDISYLRPLRVEGEAARW